VRLTSFIFAALAFAAPESDLVGSKVCAGCHASIAQTYFTTGMARTSSSVGGSSFRERFNDVNDPHNGARYRIGSNYRVNFNRSASGVAGAFDLKWAIGSGAVGRSYITNIEGFLFQAPVSYFSSAARWDLSPGFAGKPVIDLARPIEAACLQCHTTGPQLIEGTQNRYADRPFFEMGIGCERCHGLGRRHVEAMKSGSGERAIVNPAKLDAARRDSVCLQCHLTGAVRVARFGTSAFAYQPGDLLSNHLSVFVWSSAVNGLAAATDHAEQFSRSKCSQVSGAKMWCGSCHDSHSEPVPEQRASFFRQRCLTCHETTSCKEAAPLRATRQDDCRACHMPKAQSLEGEHVAFTLHSIPRRASAPSSSSGIRDLRPFFSSLTAERDLALAYASLALTDSTWRPRALTLLEKSASLADPVVLAQLAQFYDAQGKREKAMELYRRVLRLDPRHPTAAANLGIYLTQNGQSRQAMELWKDVFARYPALVGPGMNLAAAQYEAGDRKACEATLLRILRFHPDFTAARQLLEHLRR